MPPQVPQADPEGEAATCYLTYVDANYTGKYRKTQFCPLQAKQSNSIGHALPKPIRGVTSANRVTSFCACAANGVALFCQQRAEFYTIRQAALQTVHSSTQFHFISYLLNAQQIT
ncbi:hypothetical protein V1264_024884 [Littorina saxatilis]|uniref:Uncharacterized protein n=1 Tax=Littorina saxatilis TaxID=31220 RepID=A0AAN9FZB7_9CAEN